MKIIIAVIATCLLVTLFVWLFREAVSERDLFLKEQQQLAADCRAIGGFPIVRGNGRLERCER